MCKPKKKFETNTTPEYIWTIETLEPKCLVIVTWDDFYRFVKQVCTAYVQMASNFFASMYTQIMTPHKILGFFDHFFINIFFPILNKTKEGELHLGPNGFFIDLHKILIPRAH